MIANFWTAHLTSITCGLFIGLLSCGCASGYRIWAGPTVDSGGRLGGAAGMAVEIGFSSGPAQALVQEIGTEFGGRADPGAITTGSHLGYSHINYLGDTLVRFTGRLRFDSEVDLDGQGRAEFGSGMLVAVAPVLSDSDDRRTALGFEVGGHLLVPMAEETETVRGVFSGMVVFSRRHLSEWPRKCR
jgi:hypothetical protein